MFATRNSTVNGGVTRSALLRGNFKEPPPPLRPPGAIPPLAFMDACTRCDGCIRVCPTQVLVAGSGGFPQLDFARGNCTFCSRCVAACTDGALAHDGAAAPWGLIASTSVACLSAQGVTCRVCGDLCEQRAISFRLAVGGIATPVIDPTACNGCGACVAPCPVGAVSVAKIEGGAPQ